MPEFQVGTKVLFQFGLTMGLTRRSDDKSSSVLNKQHYAPLDGIRAVAILLVIVHHAFHTDNNSVVGRLLRSLSEVGWVGVNLFFVLSGFLIGGILLESKHSNHYYLPFYIRRGLRIFPLYYTFLVAYFWLTPVVARWLNLFVAGPEWPGQPILWLYLGNMSEFLIAQKMPEVLDPLWSLAVEEQIYLIWPALLALCPDRRIPGLMIVLALGSLAWRTICLFSHQSIALSSAWTPAALDAFALGTLLAYCVRIPALLPRLFKICQLGCLGAGLFIAGMWVGQGHFFYWRGPAVMLSVGLTAVALFFTALIGCITLLPRDAAINRLLSNVVLNRIGRYSYAMYIFHDPIIHLLTPSFRKWTGVPGVQQPLVPVMLFTSWSSSCPTERPG